MNVAVLPRNGVCAVIVSYNPAPGMLERLLDAVLPQVVDAVVVDNGSMYSVAPLLAERPVTVLPLGENLGVAAGFNRGIAWALERGASQILLLDQDSLPAGDMVVRLQAALSGLLAKGAAVAALGPLSCDTESGHAVGFARMGPFRFRYVEPATGEETVPADFLISSGSLMPVSALQAIGCMDEGLFIDLVDTEWFLRAAAAGLRAYGVPAALLHHGIGDRTAQLQIGGLKIGSLHQHSPQRHYYMFRNSILLSRRAYVPWRWVVNNTMQLLGMFVYFSLFTPPRTDHVRLMVRGLLDGLRRRSGSLR